MKLVTIVAALIFGGCHEKIDSAGLKKAFLAEPNIRKACENLELLSELDYDIAMEQMERVMRSTSAFEHLTSEATRDFKKIFKEACTTILGQA